MFKARLFVWFETVAETWRRVWGAGKIFSRTKIYEWRFFRKRFPFSSRKFLKIFFLVIDQVFQIFFTVLNVAYDPFFTRKTTISEKNSFIRPFFYSVRTFARIRQHYFSKYWGDQCIGRPPTPNFGGTVPLSPPRFRPLVWKVIMFLNISFTS